MPPVEGLGERQLCWCAAAPVQDPRHEHVHGDEEEQEVRDGEADPPFDERPGPDDLGGHASEGPAALGQVHDHQPDEHEANVGVVGDPHVQKLQRAECGRGRAQQTEMDRPTGSGAPRGPAVGRPLERRPGPTESVSTIRHPPAPALRLGHLVLMERMSGGVSVPLTRSPGAPLPRARGRRTASRRSPRTPACRGG